MKQDQFGNANYKKYTVWRKQPMRLVGMSERILVIDGEYIHIVPASGGKAIHDGGGKTTTVHFSNVVGCKVPRKHPTNVKVCTCLQLLHLAWILFHTRYHYALFPLLG
jgi:hypothetical protein